MKGDPPPRTDSQLLTCTTGTYWPKLDDDPDAALNWYLNQHLLVDELAWALDRHNIPDNATRPPCDVLVLLVGFSLDPLFQSICVYDPVEKIVLVVNTHYGEQSGGGYGEALAERIELLFKDARLREGWLTHSPVIEICELPDEEPDSVFRTLHAALLKDQQADHKIIIDITGGKKNIDAGAFLFAAYTAATVSYVNFELYDQRKRRPFGYSCKIGPIERNPYDAFRLRDWEEIRYHYEGYRFTIARTILKRIWKPMLDAFPLQTALQRPRPGKPTPISREEVEEALKRLDAALVFYDAWETGNYVMAYRLLPTVQGLATPSAVTLLGPDWQKIYEHSQVLAAPLPTSKYDEMIKDIASDYLPVYASNKLLFTYARDELERARRLTDLHSDHRSAFLRAAGLDEFLLKARLIRLWNSGSLSVSEVFESPSRHEREISVSNWMYAPLTRALASHDGGRHIRWALSKDLVFDKYLQIETPGYVPAKIGRRQLRLRPRSNVTPTLLYDDNCALSGEVLVQLRNQASHAYLYLSKLRTAQALELVEKNLDELALPEWAGQEAIPEARPQATARVEWAELHDWCGLTFLPVLSTLVSS